MIVVLKKFPNENIYTLLDSTCNLSNIHEIILVADLVENLKDTEKYLAAFLDFSPNLITIKLAYSGSDRGPAYGRNVGVSLSQSPNLLFVDDDAAVLDDISPLVEYLNKNICQGVQPLILRFGGEIVDSAGDFIEKYSGGRYNAYVRSLDRPLANVSGKLQAEELPSMRGAFMLVQKQSFLALNGFDGTFYYVYEDVDFGWRMITAGFKMLFVPSIRALHKGGETTNRLLISQKTLRGAVLNQNAACLKVARLSVWPKILFCYMVDLVLYEWSLIKKGTNLVYVLEDFLKMNMLFLKRFRRVASDRRLLSEEFSFKGLAKLEAMAKGEHFIFLSRD